MKILIVGENGRRHDLAGMLETEGAEVWRPPEGSVPRPAGDEVAEIATALIAFERLFAGEGVTVGRALVHAWGEEKCVEYLKRLREAAGA